LAYCLHIHARTYAHTDRPTDR